MEEKKIATSVDILINIDRFEHFQITKYSEKKITYESQEEMVQKEDQLTNELLSDIRRSLKLFCDNLGSISKEINQKMEAVSKIEDKIGKKMPTWLEEGSDPNIANKAKENSVKAVAEAHVKLEDFKAKEKANKAETADFLEGKQKIDESPKSEDKSNSLDEDLFTDDEDLFK